MQELAIKPVKRFFGVDSGAGSVGSVGSVDSSARGKAASFSSSSGQGQGELVVEAFGMRKDKETFKQHQQPKLIPQQSSAESLSGDSTPPVTPSPTASDASVGESPAQESESVSSAIGADRGPVLGPTSVKKGCSSVGLENSVNYSDSGGDRNTLKKGTDGEDGNSDAVVGNDEETGDFNDSDLDEDDLGGGQCGDGVDESGDLASLGVQFVAAPTAVTSTAAPVTATATATAIAPQPVLGFGIPGSGVGALGIMGSGVSSKGAAASIAPPGVQAQRAIPIKVFTVDF